MGFLSFSGGLEHQPSRGVQPFFAPGWNISPAHMAGLSPAL